MTYQTQENSQADGAPYELYEWIGTYQNYYYTSDTFPHTYNNNTYVPISGLKRGTIKAGTHEEDNTDLTIQVPITCQLAQDYAFQSTPPALQLNIYRFHRDATDGIKYWSGPITAISVQNEIATLTVPSVFGNLLRGSVPNVYVQPPCNNTLYDTMCKVSRAANTVNTNASAISSDGLTITLPSGALNGFPNGWFTGGEIVASGSNERRMIISQSNNVIVINYALGKLSVNQGVQISAGCDHSFTSPNGCAKFNNKKNFGGCPFVPGETNDPYAKGLTP